MSRIIVKGLPSYLSDVRLRDHFAQRGAVTDVKLMKRPDGTSRRFGFVGYRSEDEAKDALSYFNKTFVDTSRITVELAKKIGDEELKQQEEKRKALKRKADDSSTSASAAHDCATLGKKAKVNAKATADVPKKSKSKSKGVSFEEFMAVMAPKAKRKTWQNEEAVPQQTTQDILGVQPVESGASKDKATKKKAKAAQHSQASGNDKNAAAAYNDSDDDEVTEKDEAVNDEELDDLEYMRRRMRHRVGAEEETAAAQEKAFEQSDDEEDGANGDDLPDSESEDEEVLRKQEEEQRAAEEAARKEQKIVDEIMESGRLFIRNLPYSATEDEIREFFESFGNVSQVHIPLDKETKASKGLAFVTFSDPAHALSAYRAKDGSTFQGRLLHLIPAVDKHPKPDAPKTVKQNKHEKRKTEAGKDFNWGMLYMNSDAVASSIADRLGVSKSDILNPQDAASDNAAVRLALAETRIIQETKEFLANEGIDVDAFDRKERSETTMLVKNIPYGTTAEEIEELFAKHGQVGKVLIPPTGTIAVVDMPVIGEARTAFRSVAYKRFKNSILYLEKAPAGVLKPKAEGEDGPERPTIKQAPLVGKEAPKQRSAAVVLGAGTGNESEAEPGATLFVKNLSFATNDERLGQVFGGLSDFAFARIQTKADAKHPGQRLSMGYGFVGFKSVDAAKNAQKAMEGHVLDGHTLSVSFAKRGQDADDLAAAGISKKSATTKIIVKNLPFEATKRDIRELFGSQGQLKSVRLPKKFDSKTRGFAFVEYVSRREAESAFRNLKHTHLLGRHLVLQWSDSSDGGNVTGERELERARLKTRLGYVGTDDDGRKRDVAGKKAKIKLGHEDIVKAVAAEKRKKALAGGGDGDDDDDDE
ncbi:Multiple RNA-binding domain-containing protein 1 [Thecaphora frezii]